MKKYVDGEYIEFTPDVTEPYEEPVFEPTIEEQISDLSDLVACLVEMIGGAE